ncbi:MAG: hypothetical protein GY832_15415 [Chloroflexi bacterium]|nr:hypothetical protein [Chloroflexota bacterium]
MADGYSFQLSGGIMNGETVERALPEIIANRSGFDFEEYWHRLEVAAGASQILEVDVLNDARVIIVVGGEGITVTFGSTGTEELPADPALLISEETNGSGFDQLAINNNSTREQKVTVIACSYKT